MPGIKSTKVKRQCSHLHGKSMKLVLKSSKIKSTAVLFVMDLILKVKETCSFDIRWIKGHSSNKGQGLAAKEAARENQQIRITEVTLKDVKHYVQCKTAKESVDVHSNVDDEKASLS